MQKILIFTGLFFIMMGIIWPVLSKLHLGRLPGDIVIDRSGIKVYFPIVTMLLISLALSLLIRFLRK